MTGGSPWKPFLSSFFPGGVSVDIASEGDRQMDMEALPEEDPQDVISVQQH